MVAGQTQSTERIGDSEGDPASGEFNYASIVGMMVYLAGHIFTKGLPETGAHRMVINSVDSSFFEN